jgi:hypothetical protein
MINKSDETPSAYVKQAAVFIGIAVIAGIYVLVQYLIPQYAYERDMDKAAEALVAKSPAHKRLVEHYLHCRTKSFRNSSRAHCMQQMHDLSESEGLQDQAEQVSLDIRNELWKIKRNDY